ncbi:ATP synthase subunit beta [Alternaria alternata]|nr:ATP synthase subunit beta [Alternaria alternata]
MLEDLPNDLMNLAILCCVGAGESGGERGGEALLHGRKCAAADGRPAHGSAERLLDPTVEIGPPPQQEDVSSKLQARNMFVIDIFLTFNIFMANNNNASVIYVVSCLAIAS